METCQRNEASHMKLSCSGQRIVSIPPYLTQQDWSSLEGAISKDDMMSVMAKRLRAMGLTSLKENTTHQVLATLLYVQYSQGKPEMHPRAVHGMLEDFSAIFHGTPKSSTTGLAVYQENPHQCGQAWMAQAYVEGTTPACRVLALHAWFRKVPVRKSHSAQPVGGAVDSTTTATRNYLVAASPAPAGSAEPANTAR